ncbi:RidA family protein [Candidatus Dojkabacteria bacterium]|nr:RidA family protein [Candidatus Dojkabacteria bacterium]
MKTAHTANGAPASPNLLSAAVEVDGLVFTSGQIHMNEEFKLVGESMTEKAEKVMENLKCVLEGADLSFENVVKATVYVIDMAEYKEFNDVYLKYFSEPMPAREVVCVKELPLGASVEVSLIAKR